MKIHKKFISGISKYSVRNIRKAMPTIFVFQSHNNEIMLLVYVNILFTKLGKDHD